MSSSSYDFFLNPIDVQRASRFDKQRRGRSTVSNDDTLRDKLSAGEADVLFNNPSTSVSRDIYQVKYTNFTSNDCPISFNIQS